MESFPSNILVTKPNKIMEKPVIMSSTDTTLYIKWTQPVARCPEANPIKYYISLHYEDHELGYGQSNLRVIQTQTDSLSYTVHGLPSGTGFQVKVAAYNTAGLGEESDASVPTATLPRPVPGLPMVIGATDKGLRLKWNPSPYDYPAAMVRG